MSGGVYGADVAQLRAAAAELARAADRLAAVRTDLGAQLGRTPWTGNDAASFRSAWDGSHAPLVSAAADRLREASMTLRRNADAQETTSAASGGALSAADATIVPASASPASSGAASAPPAGAAPADVAAWWQDTYGGRDRAELEELIRAHPELFGGVDGLPAWVRDVANRQLLADELAAFDPKNPPTTQGSWDSAAADWVQAHLTLQNAQRMLDDDPSLSLLVLDTSDRRIELAFAQGDVDTADHVGVYTQGLFSNTNKVDGVQDAVQSMNDLLRAGDRLLIADGRGDERIAMITWMGYDSPQGLDVLGAGPAEAGADRLASFADGVRAINPQTHLTGLGHSYGSVVTSLAAQQTGAFDDVAAFGSPGLRTEDVTDLRVDPGHVYALATPWDPVAASGHFGPVPTHMPGVQELSTAPSGSLSGPGGFWIQQHSEYLVDQSTSQRNLAAVVVGAEDAMIR
jgi:uncharacterized protein YukE